MGERLIGMVSHNYLMMLYDTHLILCSNAIGVGTLTIIASAYMSRQQLVICYPISLIVIMTQQPKTYFTGYLHGKSNYSRK